MAATQTYIERLLYDVKTLEADNQRLRVEIEAAHKSEYSSHQREQKIEADNKRLTEAMREALTVVYNALNPGEVVDHSDAKESFEDCPCDDCRRLAEQERAGDFT